MPETITLEQAITGIFRDTLKIAVPSYDTDLLAAGMLDSLGFVDLMVHLEERFAFHITIESLEPDNFRCITSIAAFVSAHRKAA
jgi:acyl carrier protein